MKRTVADLAEWPYPERQLVPLTEVVHDRLNVEVFRGCTRGCRFCQAGMITRPVRERPAAQVREMVRDGLERTGYDEVALTSLSTADFSGDRGHGARHRGGPEHGERVSVSLPVLRVDAFTVGTAAQIQQVRRTGLTFAPEGGTWRMRRVINKLITEEDLYGAVDAAFSQGWRRVKLYFLIGLPTERDEDVLGIAELGGRCVEIGRRTPAVGDGRRPRSEASCPSPTPRSSGSARTPWPSSAQGGPAAGRRQRTRGLTIRWHDPEASVVEGLASRGDRRMGAVIERVWRAGGTFQEWSERFDLSLWEDGARRRGADPRRGVPPGPGRATRRCPGTTSRPGCTGTSSGPTGRTRWPRAPSRTAAGPPATTAAPAPDSGSSTWWPPPSRRPAAARAPGQDLSAGGRVPVRLVSRAS